MGYFRIYQDDYADFTIVSNYFIDKYMADANDAQLKIYLYLIRMLGADLATGVSDIADRFNYTEKDVIRALNYWARLGVLKLDLAPSGDITGVRMMSMQGQAYAQDPDIGTQIPAQSRPDVTAGTADTTRPQSVSQPDSASGARPGDAAAIIDIRDYTKPQYSHDDLTEFRNDPGTSQIIFVAEQYLQRPLTQADITTLMYVTEQLHFSDDLADYLLQYCIAHGKKSMRYIEKVAMDWAESGITTPAQAAVHVSRFDSAYDIMRALGKNNTDPSTVELEYIDKWRNTFGYDMAVINEACARTVLATDRARFKYADSILTRWYQLGIRSVTDINRLDPPKKNPQSGSSDKGAQTRNKFNQFTQNEYDYEALEKQLLGN